MLGRKNIKTKGKLKLSQCFQEFKEGERVAVVREQSLNPAFPERIQGKTGIFTGKKGKACVIKLMDGNEEKTYLIEPAHLKKLD